MTGTGLKSQSDLPLTRAQADQARRGRTRNKIIEAAHRVIAKKGVDDAMIDDFISEANVARGTFYNHFATREDLLALISEQLQDDFRHAVDTISCHVADPAERLVVGVRHLIRRSAADPQWGALVIHFHFDQSAVRQSFRQGPAADLRAAIAAGRLRQDLDIETATDLVLGSIHEAVRGILMRETAPDLAERVATFILAGLGMEWEEANSVAQRELPPVG